MRTTGILLCIFCYQYLVKSEQVPQDKRLVNFDQVEHQINMDEDEVAAGVGNMMGGNQDETDGDEAFVGMYDDDKDTNYDAMLDTRYSSFGFVGIKD